MQKSAPVAIDQEAEGLRTLRRISHSNGPGSAPLDPDLPIPRVPNGYSYGGDAGGQQADESFEDDASSDSSHLFWLPAHLHPELAPAEFRAFLHEHTSSTPSNDPAEPIGRSLSRGKSLGRQKSMLSRQYRPSANDGIEAESSDVIPTRRNIHRAMSSAQSGPSLSASELQQLEFLADEAVKSGDPTRLRSVLKRSISMNHTSVIDQMDNIGGDEADEPIVTPQPSQSLKRSVRTKIRKASLQGTGGGHRFPATRRGKVFAAAPDRYIPPYETENSSPASSENDHVQPPEAPMSQDPPRASFASDNEEREWTRPQSYSEEAAIYDSYADRASMDQDDVALAYSYPSAQQQSSLPVVYEPSPAPTQEFDTRPQPPPVAVVSPPPQPALQHPSPRHQQLPVPSPQSGIPPQKRTPSPGSGSDVHNDIASFAPSTSPSPNGKRRDKEKEREKEKKGLFGKSKWGGEKDAGKIKKDKPKSSLKQAEKSDRESTKEKESGFFGSLFGGKKKSDESPHVGSGAGPATAAALLGQSRSKTSPAITPDVTGMGYARYPIHVERAVYRLSHIKLANPRRPLHEQVLISNLMFWYLGIINKPTAPPQPATPVAQQPTAAPQDDERERLEKERIEHEQRLAAERERDQQEQARREQQLQQQQQPSPRKGGLNKAQVPGADPRGRKAEMPVKGPQYGIGMVMEQGSEYDMQQNPRQQGYHPTGYDSYGHDGGQQHRGGPPTDQQQQQQHHWQSRPERSPPPSEPQHVYHDNQYPGYVEPMQDQASPRNANSARAPPPITRQPPRSPPSSLPPGAMPPVSNDHSWLVQNQLKQGPPSANTNRGPPRNDRVQDQEHPYYQQDMPQRARSVPPAGAWPEQAPETPRQQQSLPPGGQQGPPAIRQRTPSYNAGGSEQSRGSHQQPSGGRPKTSPVDTNLANNSKLQGRSLSASAVPSNSGSREGGRSRSPPPVQKSPSGRSRSKPREEIPPQPSSPPQMPQNGVRVVRQEEWQRNVTSREEEDLPLAVYQRQQQPQYYSHPPQQHHHQTQEYDWNHPRR